MDCYCFLKAKPEIWLCPHHRYFKGETEFKSVSSIIRAVRPTDYSMVRPIVLETARLRGTFVDNYFSNWVVDPDRAPRLRHFREMIEREFPMDGKKYADDTIKRIAMLLDWWVDSGHKAIAVQKTVYSVEDGIAGTLDVCTEEYIFDLKCVYKIQDNYRPQLGAYSSYSCGLYDVGIIHVTDKKVKAVLYDAKECRDEWRRCLAEYNAK